MSCSHFETASLSTAEFDGHGELVTPGEFSTTEELYKSKEVLKNPPRRWQQGPFQLQWPVKKVVINRGFSNGGRKSHLGVDLGGRKGDSIYAAHDGIVIYAGAGFRGYGKMIILEYNKTWATLYGHLSRLKVKSGQEVYAGDLIGLMGRTGRATGVHLHFELMRDKQPVDPEPILNGPENVAMFNYQNILVTSQLDR